MFSRVLRSPSGLVLPLQTRGAAVAGRSVKYNIAEEK